MIKFGEKVPMDAPPQMRHHYLSSSKVQGPLQGEGREAGRARGRGTGKKSETVSSGLDGTTAGEKAERLQDSAWGGAGLGAERLDGTSARESTKQLWMTAQILHRPNQVAFLHGVRRS